MKQMAYILMGGCSEQVRWMGLFVCDIKSCPHNGKTTCKPGEVCTKHTVGSVTSVNIWNWDTSEKVK